MSLAQLDIKPALIDQVHDRLLGAIVDGTLAPGRRLTQEELAEMLGVSRQPVSHAIQVLRRRGLFVDSGKRGVAVAPIDADRIRNLYQVREALDGLAAELMAARVRDATLPPAGLDEVDVILASVTSHPSTITPSALIDADVAFHSALYRLSGNDALAETVSEQWPHFRRSMAQALEVPGMRQRVWSEHRAIRDAIAAGEVDKAGALARAHARRAGSVTAERLLASATQPALASAAIPKLKNKLPAEGNAR